MWPFVGMWTSDTNMLLWVEHVVGARSEWLATANKSSNDETRPSKVKQQTQGIHCYQGVPARRPDAHCSITMCMEGQQ